MLPGMGAKIARAAGNSAILLRNDKKIKSSVLLKLKSGEHRIVSNECVASVGIVSNTKIF